MRKFLKCWDCGFTGDEHEFIDHETHEQKCPKDGSTLVDTPAGIARMRHGGNPKKAASWRDRIFP